MQWTVSVKGVVLDGAQVLLGLNDRNEWELPGGQLDDGEAPREAAAREVAEESGLAVMVGKLLLADIFEVIPGREVLIIAFRCSVWTAKSPVITRSVEHRAMEWVPLSEIDGMRLPAIYRRAITEALQTEPSSVAQCGAQSPKGQMNEPRQTR